MRSILLAALLVLVPSLAGCGGRAAGPVLVAGHSHNDYRQARPLAEALRLGYMSVEADVFLVDGDLLVAHDRKDCRPDRTLRSLYLRPLGERAAGGRVYPGVERPMVLLVDIKTAGEAAYAELDRQLAEFAGLVTSCEAGVVTERAVTVIVSGDCPRDAIAGQRLRRAFVDGRGADLDGPRERAAPASLVPLVSLPWTERFTWIGLGPMPTAQREALALLAAEAHARGYRIRFWGTPNLPAFWEQLLRAGVDVIGVDDLELGARTLGGRAGPATIP